MDEREQTKGEGASVGWGFWVGASVFVLMLVSVAAIVVAALIPVIGLSIGLNYDEPVVVIGVLASALVGLAGGILLVWGMYHKRQARLAAR